MAGVAVSGCRSLLALLGAIFAASDGHAQTGDAVADFYRDKRLNILIGVNVGGGYDLEARLIARFIAAYIPGNPTMVPQNVIGAGGLRMANQLYNVSPKDGTNLGMFPNTLIALQAVGGEGVQYHAERFAWLGTLSTSPITLAVRGSANVRSINDLKNRTISVAASTPGAITYTYPFLANKVVGLNLKIVTGYQGTNEMIIALQRGEVDAVVNSWSSWKSMYPTWPNDGTIDVVLQSDPKAADLAAPSISELAKSADDRALVNLVLAGDQIGKPLAMTPDVPKDRLQAMRVAYERMVKDPDFLATAEKARIEVAPVFGDKLQVIIENVLASSATVKATAKTIIQ
jgi:tripartite-type tricarboxylate transporter receptor subunit TctC